VATRESSWDFGRLGTMKQEEGAWALMPLGKVELEYNPVALGGKHCCGIEVATCGDCERSVTILSSFSSICPTRLREC